MSDAPLHLDDLAAPVFSPEARRIIDAIAAFPVALDSDAVLATASAQTSLTDFGSDDFRERLDLITACMRKDADLSPTGRVTNFLMLVRFAANRLRVEDLVKRHPEILAERIERPLIVAGLARSGTTHLLNLLSCDTRLRSLPYWEALEPVPVPGETPGPDGEDPRLARCRQAVAAQDVVMPRFKLMFNLQPERTHEEIELLALDFSTMFIENLGLFPRWRDYYMAHDQTPHYRYLKKVLQVLQWLKRGERWLLKSPQHLEQFGTLMKVFPDATVVVTHRDPVATVTSMATLSAYSARMSRDPVRPGAIAGYWAERIEQMLRACVRDRALLPDTQSMDLRFHDFNADDIGSVRRIYALAGLEFTPSVETAMRGFVANNPRAGGKAIAYDLAALGLDGTALSERLRFYSERFATREERSG
jgi:hypothetical protein